MCAIKDFYYEDNTFSSELKEDKTVIGKVFDVNPANRHIENSGAKFVFADKDFFKDGKIDFMWRTDYESINCEDVCIDDSNLSTLLEEPYLIRNSLSQNKVVWNSKQYTYEAVMSLYYDNQRATEDHKEWFVPTLYQWKRILYSLLGVTLNKDGSFHYSEFEEYITAKAELNLFGQYWAFPISFSDKRLFYIDFDHGCVCQTRVSDGKRCKIRPVLMIQ